MTDERIKILREEIKKGKKLNATYLTKSEREEIINDTVLNEEDRKIVWFIFIDGMNMTTVANKMYLDVRTVKSRIKRASPKLCETLKLRILGNIK